MKGIILLVTIVALVAAQNDVYGTPVNFGASQGVNTALTFGVGNNGTSSITLVSFTVSPSDSSVFISYPNGATKTSIGTVSAGSVGSGYFYAVGGEGIYGLTFSISYRRSNTQYTKSVSGSLTISGPGTEGKRSAEVDWFPETETDETLVDQSKRANDITITPSAFSATAGVATWSNLVISASTNVRDVSFVVAPSDSSVTAYYPSTGNSLGSISSGHSKTTSFAINGGEGIYSLYLVVQYRKGSSSTWYYEYKTASLTISSPDTSSARSIDLDLVERAAADEVTVRNVDGSVKMEYVVGFGVGIALIAAVAVGIAIFALKRNSAPTLV